MKICQKCGNQIDPVDPISGHEKCMPEVIGARGGSQKPPEFTINELIAIVMKATAFDLIRSRHLIPKGVMDKLMAEVEKFMKNSEKNPRYQHEVASIAAALAEKLVK